MRDTFDRLLVSGEALLIDVIEDAFDRVAPEKGCESPIEEAFAVAAAALCATRYCGEVDYVPAFGLTHKELIARTGDGKFRAWIAPQVHVCGYRVDFMVAHLSGLSGFGGIVVELDGHEFHERTKKQAARDKAKDRHLQDMGFKVFRFTGSEVWADAFGCADDVLGHALSMAIDADYARHLIREGDINGATRALSWPH